MIRGSESKLIVFGIIPAKRLSSGLRDKNILPMAGHPMIYYILDSVLKASELDKCWVSTDNDQIEDYCLQQGMQVIRHDPSLSSETSPTFGVIANIVRIWREQGENPDVVVTMRATSPLCEAEDIDKAVRMLIDSGADSVIAVTQSDVHPYRTLVVNRDGFLEHFDPDSPENKIPIRRQELSPVYIRTGAIYATRREAIERGSLWGQRSIPYIMPKERSVNVNDEIDFFLAEQLILKKRT